MGATVDNLYNRYNSRAYTHEYLVGFCLKGTVYSLRIAGEKLVRFLSVSKASRGYGDALRFRPNVFQKKEMLELGASVVMAADEFAAYVAQSGKNKGEAFEKLMVELDGQSWEKDSTPFWQAADATIAGVEVQIKYESATFTNEKFLEKIGA